MGCSPVDTVLLEVFFLDANNERLAASFIGSHCQGVNPRVGGENRCKPRSRLNRLLRFGIMFISPIAI